MSRVPLNKRVLNIPKPEKRGRGRPRLDVPHPVTVQAKLAYEERRILEEFLKDFDVTAAGMRAGIRAQYAHATVTRIMQRPHVMAALHYEMSERQRRADIQVDEVIRYWYQMAKADPREFNPLRWRCCRFCWGEDNLYQFTPSEFRKLQIAHQKKYATNPADAPMLDEQGGTGFNQLRDPMRGPEWDEMGFKSNHSHSCPECNGKGQPRIEEIDLSKLSPGALLIFEGIKVSSTGDIEFKLNNNRSKGMEQVAQLLGFVRPRKPVWAANFTDLTADELDAMLAEAEQHGYIAESDIDNLRPLIEGKKVEPLVEKTTRAK